MKFEIAHSVFHKALLRGGVAIKSHDAQNPEMYRKQPILRCVRLVADNQGLLVESAAGGIAARTFVPKTEVKVGEVGTQCVEVSEMIEDLGKLKFPHNLQIEFDPNQPKAGESIPLRLWVKAFNQKGREAFAWSYDVHPSRQFSKVAYSSEEPQFSASMEQFKKSMAAVEFTKRDDDQHILDNVLLGVINETLQLGTTDTKRGSVVKVSEGVKINRNSELYLVNWDVLNSVLDCFDSTDVLDFVFEKGDEHLTINGPKGITSVRLSLPDRKFTQKLGRLFDMTKTHTKFSVVIDEKDELLQATMIMDVRAQAAHYHFKKDAEEVMMEYSGRHRPAIVGCQKIKVGLASPIPLSVQLFLEVLQKIEGNTVIISVADDENRVFVQDQTNPNYFYMMLRRKVEVPEV